MEQRQMIKKCIRAIRQARSDRNVPALVGQGYTIAVQGSPSCLHRIGEGFNFSARWDSGSVYWSHDDAQDILAALQPLVDMDLEVVHRNDLRDRDEASQVSLLNWLWTMRHTDGGGR